MVKERIRLETNKDVVEFVQKLNSDGSIDKYIIEDELGRRRVDARSFLGVIYASSEFSGKMFLVNETEDGKFPGFVSKFMPLSDNDGNYIHN